MVQRLVWQGPRLQPYKTNWSWPTDVEVWLRHQAEGFTLNFPCGTSFVGDVRADIDRSVRPTIVADLRHPPFRDRSFDTVICDPPFSFYNRFRWAQTVAELTRRKIMFSSPLVAIRLSSAAWTKSWHVSETNTMFTRLWPIFTRTTDLKAHLEAPRERIALNMLRRGYLRAGDINARKSRVNQKVWNSGKRHSSRSPRRVRHQPS